MPDDDIQFSRPIMCAYAHNECLTVGVLRTLLEDVPDDALVRTEHPDGPDIHIAGATLDNTVFVLAEGNPVE